MIARAMMVVLLALALAAPARAEETPAAPARDVDDVRIRPVPKTKRGGRTPFYTRRATVDGFVIQASDGPADAALLEAAWIVRNMLAARPKLLATLVRRGVRLTVMAHDEFTTQVPEHATLEPPRWWDRRARGLGPSPGRRIVSCAEENLLGYPGDPYRTESILIHEFAHAIDLEAARHLDRTFEVRLTRAYRAALADGLWKGTYAATNKEEYWAEGVQSWFDANTRGGASHGDVDTREKLTAHDPRLAALIRSVLGDAAWRYVPARGRAGTGHLARYEPATAPTFAWPKGLDDWYRDYERKKQAGEGYEPLGPLAGAAAPDRSPVTRLETRILFANESGATVTLFWLDHAGVRRPYGTLRAGQVAERQTLVRHVWVVTDETGRELARFRAGERPGRAVIRAPRTTK